MDAAPVRKAASGSSGPHTFAEGTSPLEGQGTGGLDIYLFVFQYLEFCQKPSVVPVREGLGSVLWLPATQRGVTVRLYVQTLGRVDFLMSAMFQKH